MQAAANTYLKYIDLTILENWDVQGLLDAKFNCSDKYESARIGDFLIKSRHAVNIEDGKTYNRIAVKINNRGVVPRGTEKGVNIRTKKWYWAKAGQFIISEKGIENGAFGIIPEELDQVIVTNAFSLFDVNAKKINPQFLLLAASAKARIKRVQKGSRRANSQRMDVFLNQKIPLPKLEEQDKIASNFLNKANEAERLKNEAEDLKKQRTKSKKLQAVNYSDLVKWGGDFIGVKNNGNGIYKEVSVHELCQVGGGGTPSRNRKEYYE